MGLHSGVEMAVDTTGAERRASRAERRWPKRLKMALGALTVGAVLNVIPSDARVEPPYREPTIQVIHEGGVCPPGTQFGVLQVPGAGMSSTGVFAAWQTEAVLGEDFDECDAGIKYGTNYDAIKNTRLAREFVTKNNLDTLVFFAHSFGAIGATDIVNNYERMYPDAETKFAIVLFSSPGNVDDLHWWNWAMSQTLAHITTTDDAIELMTWASTMYQSEKPILEAINDPQLQKDVKINADDTPHTLVEDETKRLLKGIERLPDELDVLLYYIGDERDQVVQIQKAMETIEQETGKKIISARKLILPSGRMSYHADLWWQDNQETYEPSVKEYLYDALGKMGVQATSPVLPFQGRCTLTRISCR